MKIQPLDGKYYGTEITKDAGKLKGLRITLWLNTGNPSDRQLEKWGLDRKKWDENALVDDGWGGLCGVKDSDYLADGHYESNEVFEFAMRICEMSNPANLARESASVDQHSVVGHS